MVAFTSASLLALLSLASTITANPVPQAGITCGDIVCTFSQGCADSSASQCGNGIDNAVDDAKDAANSVVGNVVGDWKEFTSVWVSTNTVVPKVTITSVWSEPWTATWTPPDYTPEPDPSGGVSGGVSGGSSGGAIYAP